MIYLDTSAVVPLFVRESASDAVDAWLESCSESLVSSDWLTTEFASALSIKVRRGELNATQASAVWKDFGDFCASGLRLLPVGRSAFAEAAKLTRDAGSGLRAGDSLHMAVALDAGVKALATADEVLARNATAKGLSVTRL
jgi:predicted nucleic acid-binding protein